MHSPSRHRKILRQLRQIRAPQDYFAESRSSPDLWPERILCFTRQGRTELEREPPTRHHHHRHVLIIPWAGTGEVHVDEQQFVLSPGHALLILPFQFHYRFRLRRDSILWQFITFEMRSLSLLEPLRSHPLRRLGVEDGRLLSAFIRAWTAPEPQNAGLASWLSLILGRLRCAPVPSRKRGDAASQAHSKQSLLARINRECMPRLHEVFGLKELAGRLAISESHLRASFRKETGISLGQHVRRLRLQKAMSLLAQSELSITQVAERCGFDTVFTFSRSFRRFAGIPATEYRCRCLLA